VAGGLWTDLRVVAETGSTNADVAEAARSGAAEGLVVVAESQTGGRGRLTRRWQAPPRAGITLSVLLRPSSAVPVARLGWLPLLAGVAIAEAVERIAVVDTALKWPNDLLVSAPEERRRDGSLAPYGKCAGVLAEVVAGAGGTAPPAVVLGIGLNVSQTVDELPTPAGKRGAADLSGPAGPGGPAGPAGLATKPTSLALAGATCTDRDPLLRGILRGLADWYGRWCDAGADPEVSGVRDAYRERCTTLGREVVVFLPDGELLRAHASDVDTDGRLVLRTAGGERAVAAGDVQHVR